MKKGLAISLVVLGFAPSVASFHPTDEAGKTAIRDRRTSTVAIEKVIRDSIAWALTKDRPLMESTMAHDESLFIFNPTSEPTIGWSRLETNFDFWMDPRFKATACEIWDMRIGVSRSGDVAWWSCMLNDLAEWDGNPAGWKDTRWTGVLEKRDGKWLIVQMHFSFAADKVAAQARAKVAAGVPTPAVKKP
jgi:ketosteroid isomerase-like protein